MDLNEIIKSLVTMYYEYYTTMVPIPVDVTFTDNLGRIHCELRPDRRKCLAEVGMESDNDHKVEW